MGTEGDTIRSVTAIIKSKSIAVAILAAGVMIASSISCTRERYALQGDIRQPMLIDTRSGDVYHAVDGQWKLRHSFRKRPRQ